MDDLSRLSQGLGGGGTGGTPAPEAVSGLAGAIEGSGGLDALLGQFRRNGLGNEVDSWVSGGPNQPVDPQRLGSALGSDTVQRLSSGSGLDIGALLPMLAMFLPQIIDMLTPDGQAPAGGLDSQVGGAGGLGGLLGGLLGGGGGAGAGGLDDLLGGLGGMLGGDRGR